MQQDWKSIGSYGTVGLEFALSVLFGLFLGRWLDEKFGTDGWLALTGFGFGLAAGVRAIYRALKRANKEAQKLELEEQKARQQYHEDRDP